MIVESFRNDKKQPRLRIIRHVGTALTDKEVESFKNLAEYIKADLEAQKTPGLFEPEQLAEMAIEARKRAKDDDRLNVNLKNLREQCRISTGVHEAFGKVYNQLGFDNFLGARKAASAKNLHHLVMARIANPNSKRGSVADLANDFGINLSSMRISTKRPQSLTDFTA